MNLNVTIGEGGWRQTGPMTAGNWFLALVVPQELRLERAAAGLPPGPLRLAGADLHCTLAFLGSCGEERALLAWQALAQLRHPPISVRPAGWRAMGPPQRPSAWALTLGQGSQLTAGLIERWRPQALAAAGLPADHRHALPHITLARAGRAAGAREAMTDWIRAAPVPAEPFALREIGLYGWAGDRSTALFRIIRRRPLDQPASNESQAGSSACGTGRG